MVGYKGCITELILADNLDPVARTGSRTPLARWQPGTLLPGPVRHDFHEDVFLLSGDLIVGCDAEGRGASASTRTRTRAGPDPTGGRDGMRLTASVVAGFRNSNR
jgi:hypothetical protein